MGTYETPETREQALVEALYLVLIAEGPAKMAAMTLAEQHSRGLRNETFRICEASARERYEADEARV